MNCPHCKKIISKVWNDTMFKRAEELWRHKLSIRDISRTLNEEGYPISAATVGRYFQSINAKRSRPSGSTSTSRG